MNEISIGAVGAAAIAGIVSLLGLIVAKEQKTSEFRQAWIDELRKCFVAYLVNINAITDTIRLISGGDKLDRSALIPHYKSLNEASHGIRLRVNGAETTAKELLEVMSEFERLAEKNDGLSPDNIRSVETKFLSSSQALLKFEWRRVKRGENVFVWTKNIVIVMVVSMVALLVFASVTAGSHPRDSSATQPTPLQLHRQPDRSPPTSPRCKETTGCFVKGGSQRIASRDGFGIVAS